ncbi:ABC transporter permease [Labrys wisconsinensis]|uniref:Ribose transport system permease protein n=1 Tax=Labrys wisconsinensis TaxID=425677 RepID=A0ABU0JIE5_9HYPH|nr:ABC transporter permease [Labrys wisconsinensis]MDQ0474042.1 ribose transport system permease protein [Labrys wisconsinensis]
MNAPADIVRRKPRAISQEAIVFALTAIIFAIFALLLPSFLTGGNLLALVQNVSILGVLGVAMAMAIIGRGIDLSIVATMAVSVAWVLQLTNHGMALEPAILLGFGLALAIGLVNGILVAYVEIPAIFATLAMGTAAYGCVRSLLLEDNLVYLKAAGDTWFKWIGSGAVLGVPNPVLLFAAVALVGEVLLRVTTQGRFLYAMGDNPSAARITGVPMRPLIVLQYVSCAAIAFVAGVIMATSVDSMETRVARSNLVYDVILVVVIGGVGLSGGKGTVRNVVVGTLLIGVLLNGMTIMNVPYTLQNIVKSLVLLAAIVIDSLVNPRDEQTSQQGDI